MKLKLYLMIAFAGAALGVSGQAIVEVTLKGVKPGDGSLRVGLFTAGNFLETPVDGKIVKASNESIVLKFENVREGDYALSVVHDANENGKLDKSKLGIPKEGFAFSNNAMGKKGPPAYEKARFEVKGTSSVKQELTMRYP